MNKKFALDSYLLYAAVLLLVGAAFAGMIEPISSIFRYVPRDYNEGWNAYWSDIAWSGGKLYPPVNSEVSNNYPPFSFYAVGALGHVIGDNIFAGRLLATLSLLSISANIFIWLRGSGSPRFTAIFSAALFMAAFSRYAPTYVGVDDPQLFAQALILTGNTLLWRGGFSTRAMIGASFLMILGGLSKHLLIPLPLATTAWIAIYRRDKLLIWVASSLALLATAILIMMMLYGPIFFEDLTAGRTYSSHLAANAWHRLINDISLLLLISASVLLAVVRETSVAIKRQATFSIIYWILSALVGAFASAGAGVDRNCYFDLVIAACFCVAVGLECVKPKGPIAGVSTARTWLATAIAFTCGAVLAYQSAMRFPAESVKAEQMQAREAAAFADIDAIKRLGRGSAACETLALCYWAKSPFLVDFYNFGQKLAIGAVPPAACAKVFVNNGIHLVQVSRQEGTSSLTALLPRYCSDIIGDHFRTVSESPFGLLMVRD